MIHRRGTLGPQGIDNTERGRGDGGGGGGGQGDGGGRGEVVGGGMFEDFREDTHRNTVRILYEIYRML
jgi:hypothetical protein